MKGKFLEVNARLLFEKEYGYKIDYTGKGFKCRLDEIEEKAITTMTIIKDWCNAMGINVYYCNIKQVDFPVQLLTS